MTPATPLNLVPNYPYPAIANESLEITGTPQKGLNPPAQSPKTQKCNFTKCQKEKEIGNLFLHCVGCDRMFCISHSNPQHHFCYQKEAPQKFIDKLKNNEVVYAKKPKFDSPRATPVNPPSMPQKSPIGLKKKQAAASSNDAGKSLEAMRVKIAAQARSQPMSRGQKMIAALGLDKK